jgi:hypothetical protein
MVARAGIPRHHGFMGAVEKRRHARRRITGIAAQVDQHPPGLVTGVVDLSEGGACLEWPLSDTVRVGTALRLRFLLAGGQSIEVDGRVVRIRAGHAGIEFLSAQQDIVRQLLAEARSED